MNKKSLLLLGAALVAAFVYQSQSPESGTTASARLERQPSPAVEASAGHAREVESALEQAIRQRAHDVQVEGSGTVIKLLRDDLDGSRHQKFLLRIPSGQVLLIVHNIDLAPRIDGLRAGGIVDFSGEYVWNEKGGLVHWTHHDPAGQHESGWLKYAGREYR